MTDDLDSIKEKHETVSRLLEDDYVLVHVRSDAPGLVIPAHLLENPTVTLKLSRLFRGGIEVQEDRIVTDLLFNHSYFTCEIPFVAVWAVSTPTGATTVWDAELGMGELPAAKLAPAPPRPEPAAAAKKKPRDPAHRPHLRRVK